MAMKRRISPSHRYEMSYERHDWDEIEAIHATIWKAFILMRENVEIYYLDLWPQNQLRSSLGHRVSRYKSLM